MDMWNSFSQIAKDVSKAIVAAADESSSEEEEFVERILEGKNRDDETKPQEPVPFFSNFSNEDNILELNLSKIDPIKEDELEKCKRELEKYKKEYGKLLVKTNKNNKVAELKEHITLLEKQNTLLNNKLKDLNNSSQQDNELLVLRIQELEALYENSQHRPKGGTINETSDIKVSFQEQIHSLEKQNERLITLLKEKEKQISEKNDIESNLQTTLSEKDQQLCLFRIQEQEHEAQFDNLRLTVNDLQKTSLQTKQEFEAVINENMKEINQLKNQLAENDLTMNDFTTTKQEIVILNKTIYELNERLQEQTKDFELLHCTLGELEESNTSLTNANASLITDIKQIEQETLSKDKEHSELLHIIKMNKNDLNEKNDQIRLLTNEIETLEKGLHSNQTHLHDKIKEFKNTLLEKNNELDSLKITSNEKIQKVEELETRLHEAIEQIDSLNEKNTSSNTIDSVSPNGTKEFEKLKGKLQIVIAESLLREEEIQGLYDENEQLQHALGKLREEKESLENKIAVISKPQIEGLNKHQQIEMTNQQHQEIIKEIEGLNHQKIVQNKEIHDLKNTIQDFKDVIENKNKEIDDLKITIQDFNDLIKKQNNEIEGLLDQQQENIRESEDFKKKILDCNLLFEKKNKEFEELQKVLKDNKQTQEQKFIKIEEFQNQSNDMKTKIVNLSKENGTLQTDLTQLQTAFKKKKDQLKKFKKDNLRLKQHLLSMEENYEQMNNDNVLEIEHLQQKIRDEVPFLQNKLREEMYKNEQRSEENLIQKDHFKDLTLENIHLRELVSNNQKELNNLQTVLEDFQDQQESLISQSLAKKKKKITTLKERITVLEMEIDNLNTLSIKYHTTQHQLQEIKGQYYVKTKSLAEHMEMLQHLTDALDKTKETTITKEDAATFLQVYIQASDKIEPLNNFLDALGVSEKGKSLYGIGHHNHDSDEKKESLPELWVQFLESEATPKASVKNTENNASVPPPNSGKIYTI